MPLKQTLLTALFSIHLVAFVVVLARSRRPSLLLPISVFTLLVLVQLLWNSTATVHFGPLPDYPLRSLLRVTAIVLAVPSIGLMVRRIVVKRRAVAAVSG